MVLMEDAYHIDPQLLDRLRRALRESRAADPTVCTPYVDWAEPGAEGDTSLGHSLMRRGECGCLIVAGGQGTRLGFSGPKGMFPVTLVQKKTLFQLLCERVRAASIQAERSLPLAVMTSPDNDQIIRDYFHQQRYFGLQESQVDFFAQGILPLLDDNGNPFRNDRGLLATGPDGNGASLAAFCAAGIASRWQAQGVRALSFLQIDNALGDPFDAELLGYHVRNQFDITLKAVWRDDPLEKVGVVVRREDKVQVVEYTEMSEAERLARTPEGQLRHRCANLSMFCFSLDFVQHVGKQELPWHLAHKAVKSEHGEMMAWKFEKFIFDVLLYSRSTGVLVVPRERCFAALKNRSGADSLQTVQQGLLRYDREVYAKIFGRAPPSDAPLELAPSFYYPTPALLEDVRGRPVPSGGYLGWDSDFHLR